MKKLFLLLTLSLLFFNVTYAIGAENCEKQSSVFTDVEFRGHHIY